MNGLPLIGRGVFSTVYRKNTKTVLIKSVDPVKECMAMGWFPNSRMFPKIARVAIMEDAALYEQRHYPKVRSLKSALKPAEWEFYKQLRGMQEGINLFLDDYRSLDSLQALIKALPKKYARRKEALLGAIDALTNYGVDIRFEISPRNVTAHKGNLVLLDCFFMASKLKEVKESKRRFNYGKNS